MRKSVNSKTRKALPAIAAAVFGAWLGAPAAHGDFIVTTSAGTKIGLDTVYEVFAQNTGTNNTGTNLAGFNLTVTTTAHDLIIDTAGDIDGDSSADADVDGALPVHLNTTQPKFNLATGTFMGLPASASSTTANVSAETITDVYVNNQTAYYNPATQTPANWHTTMGTLNSNFLAGTVSSLEMVVAATGSGVADTTSAVPFANIVVLTGTTFTIQGTLTGNTGSPFTIPNTTLGVTGSNSAPTISVTGTNPGTNSIGSITMTGSNGSYTPMSTGSIASAAQTTGYLTVNDFSPPGDSEIYALAVDSNGTLAAGSTLSSIISALNTALQSADGSSASVTLVSSSVGGLFPFANVQLNLPGGPNPSTASPAILAYSFANYTTNGAITVTDIGIVPEPASVGVLVLGGLGLLGRRRKRAWSFAC